MYRRGSSLFVGGGLVDKEATNEIYEFNLDDQVWTLYSSLKIPRAYFGFHFSASTNKVYAFGGRNRIGPHAEFVDTIECSADDSEWAVHSRMPLGRSHFAHTFSGGRLLIAGGQTPGNYSTKTVQSWTLQPKDEWKEEEPMNHLWEGFSLVSIHPQCDYVYALGGILNDDDGTQGSDSKPSTLIGEQRKRKSDASERWEDIRYT